MSAKFERDADSEVFIARLHRDKIELYEQVHETMTRSNADAHRRRFTRLEIFRLDDMLVMIKHPEPGPEPEESVQVQAEQKRWRDTVGECFAEPWRPAKSIFDLTVTGR